MASSEITTAGRGILQSRVSVLRALAALAAIAATLIVFRDSLAQVVDIWLNSEEYNFGPIVPPLVALMLWRDGRRCDRPYSGGWTGLAIMLVGLALGFLEFLSQTRFPGQLGLFVCIIGIAVAYQGERRSLVLWPPLLLLLFAVPPPDSLRVQLTSALQLVSSQGAVGLLRSFDVVVFREGNIIDLGLIKLEVAEACSGLRYLLPLATFAYICAYLFKAPLWQRSVVLLTSIPITVAMNVFRIALTGVLVEEWGVSAAEGFFHAFEGWAVYCLCVGLLLIVMKLLCLISRKPLLQSLDLDWPASQAVRPASFGWSAAPSIVAVAMVLGLGALELGIGERPVATSDRLPFAVFPRQFAEWRGTELPVDQSSLNTLKATDYLSVGYDNGRTRVDVWVAYYSAQVAGGAVHSPQVCIPGGGWEIESVEQRTIALSDGGSSRPLPLQRLIIRRGNDRAMVYYWFVEAGQPIADETAAKLKLLANAILENRRDGALVRFMAPIEGKDDAAADGLITQFIATIDPTLRPYLD
jgi:exosortase D (VPLPA-CTERM-specific)